jgi:hypothetical protein
MKPGAIYIGTSGWSYKSWAQTFYPSDLPPSKQLTFYATKFPTVEINHTFYRLPTNKEERLTTTPTANCGLGQSFCGTAPTAD